ncbi:unnamed protein product [Phytophthora lilii]|uniref:Unnamed protein product n=1 Tax=Phytophthora lilii TaxID=2077276 RepID=A0A9W7CMH4_9STRA|nr:unnamed protein product [Phytophthora lilii]
MEVPLLLCVELALSTEFEAFPHIVQSVNDFLMPQTIDGAIYNDLPHVLKTYGSRLPCTVGAMDGAAARGRLDILQRLQLTRTEGCSSAAFIAAASRAHLEVLWWLNEFYAGLSRPAEMVKAAAAHGHTRVVGLLWRKLSSDELQSVLDEAVAADHQNVAELVRSKMSIAS